ncbi:MAG: hypothetical protein RLZZ303_2489 [Candidatus Hydrogenedentota bacterium]
MKRLACLFLLLLACPVVAQQPNVLFLFADDLRPDALGFMGHPDLKTPNLDRLGASGMCFENAYLMGSRNGAVCMPSRAMLMTGMRLFDFDASAGRIPSEFVTFPERLRAAGYETFIAGKWHQDKASLNRAFSTGSGIFLGGMHDPFAIPLLEYDPSGAYTPESAHVTGEHATTRIAKAARSFLEQRVKQRPFLAYVSFTAPHDPRVAPSPFNEGYPPDKMSLPDNFLPEHPFDNGELRIRDELLAEFPREPSEVKRHLSDYYAMITHMDAEIGGILDTLEAQGLADNTLVVFASDHGLAIGSHGLMGKQNCYEHSMKLPLILSGKGVPKGRRSDALVYLNDLYPTLLEWCGLESAHPFARSLMPLLRGESTVHRQFVTSYYRDFQQAIRMGPWKYIRYTVNGSEREQLFKLDEDPAERVNLVEDSAHQATRDSLRSMLALSETSLREGLE